MNDREEAKMRRNSGLPGFFSDNAAAYAADNAFLAIVKKFNTDYGVALSYAGNTGLDNSGFSQEKLNAKNAAGLVAATLSGRAQVILESLGMFSVANGLHDSESYYTHVADLDASSRLQAVYSLLNANLLTITADYVTAEDLTNLQNLTNTFMQTGGSSQQVHAQSPVQTKKFKSALKVVDVDIKNMLKLGKTYKTTNVDFYNGLVAGCKMPAIIDHITSADITVNDSVTGAPIVGAKGSFSNSKNGMVSDANGFMQEDHMLDGNPTLTITATGYPVYTSLVHIVHGTDNSFHVLLTKG